MSKLVISLTAILFFAVCASAQIEGRVTDAKGNGVPNVAVTATGEDGEVAASAESDEDGNYAFEGLAAGKYTIAWKSTSAFLPAVRKNVEVTEDETTKVYITLTAAATTPQSQPVKPASAPEKPPVKADPVEDIVNKYIDALGGRDKLLSLRTIRITSVTDNFGSELTNTVIQSHLLGSRSETSFPTGSILTLVTPTSGYIRDSLHSPNFEPMSADDLKRAQTRLDIQSPLLDYKAKGTSVQLLGTERLAGDDQYKLKLTFANGVTIVYFINARTYLLTKTVDQQIIQGTPNDREVGYTDYKKNADGYLFPYSIFTVIGQFSAPSRVRLIETNVGVDPAIFEKPE